MLNDEDLYIIEKTLIREEFKSESSIFLSYGFEMESSLLKEIQFLGLQQIDSIIVDLQDKTY